MVRAPSEHGMKRGTWSPDEDHKLTSYIHRYRIWNWDLVAQFAGLSRSGKSCRLRWMNYLRPNIRRGNFSKEEEEIIIQMQKNLGNRWSKIASKLPGRTDNEIKNYWNTRFRKKIVHKSEINSESHESRFPEMSFDDRMGHDDPGMICEALKCSGGMGHLESGSSDNNHSEVGTTRSDNTENKMIMEPTECFIELGSLWEEPFQIAAPDLCMGEDPMHHFISSAALFQDHCFWQF